MIKKTKVNAAILIIGNETGGRALLEVTIKADQITGIANVAAANF